MKRSIVFAGLLASTMLSASAFAEPVMQNNTAAPMATHAVAPMSTTGEWRASKLIGVNIYNEQNEKLGDINEILLSRSGQVEGYVVGVGGFLGMGEHDVKVPMKQITFVNQPMKTSASTTTPTTATTTGAANNTRSIRAADEKWYPDHGVMNANKDQLKAMPQFKYSDTK